MLYRSWRRSIRKCSYLNSKTCVHSADVFFTHSLMTTENQAMSATHLNARCSRTGVISMSCNSEALHKYVTEFNTAFGRKLEQQRQLYAQLEDTIKVLQTEKQQ